MKTLRVNGYKFSEMNLLNAQLEKVLTRLGYTSGIFEIREDYERSGAVYLVLS